MIRDARVDGAAAPPAGPDAVAADGPETAGADAGATAVSATMDPVDSGTHRRDWRNPSIEAAVLLLLTIVGVRIGLTSLYDNSFLTHLSTGRIILDTGAVPSVDPYSWTAHGEPWTVQSWGASVLYAGAESAVGLVGIRILNAACISLLAILVWKSTAPARGLVGRLLVTTLVVAMGTTLWVERPLLFGSVCLVLVLLAGDGRLDPRWLIPVMWLWVNVHGSFPFGPLVLGLLMVGRWLDERSRPTVELKALGWAVLGTCLGAISPVGPKLLTFPLQLLSRTEAFDRVAEWEPPHWDRPVEKVFLIQLLLAAVLVVARNRRWRAILPLVVFGAAAVSSTRNILPASLVLAPVLAHGLRDLGNLRVGARPPVMRPVALALVSVLAVVTVSGLSQPDTDLSSYPQEAAAWMRDNGLLDREDRVVTRDFVGNYLHYRYGPDEVRVFMDDRVDMYPLPVIRSYGALITEGSDFAAVLQRYRATAVLWDVDSVLGRWLEEADGWKVVWRDADWLVAVPDGGADAP